MDFTLISVIIIIQVYRFSDGNFRTFDNCIDYRYRPEICKYFTTYIIYLLHAI